MLARAAAIVSEDSGLSISDVSSGEIEVEDRGKGGNICVDMIQYTRKHASINEYNECMIHAYKLIGAQLLTFSISIRFDFC